jgi:hypothetical protein
MFSITFNVGHFGSNCSKVMLVGTLTSPESYHPA